MSITVSSWVWNNSRSTHGARLVALAIAEFADKKGEAYPSIATIAERCRLSERAVHDGIKELVQLGELTVSKKQSSCGTNLYQLVIAGSDISSQPKPSRKAKPAALPAISAPSEPPIHAESAVLQKLHPAESAVAPCNIRTSDTAESAPSPNNPYKDEPSIEPSGNRQGEGAFAPSVSASDTNALTESPTPAKPSNQPKRQSTSTGTRLPTDWKPGPEMREWAETNCPNVNAKRETEIFRLHFTASAEKNAKKRDWLAAWKKWMLTEQGKAERTLPHASQSGNQRRPAPQAQPGSFEELVARQAARSAEGNPFLAMVSANAKSTGGKGLSNFAAISLSSAGDGRHLQFSAA